MLRVSVEAQKTWKTITISRSLITTYSANMRRKKRKQVDFSPHNRRGAATLAGAGSGRQKKDNRHCSYRKRSGQIKEKCFGNPDSSSYRGEDFGKDDKTSSSKEGSSQYSKKKKKPVLAKAFVNSCNRSFEKDDDEAFVLDSGAIHHICANLSPFESTYKIDEIEITLADESVVTCDTAGKIDSMLDSKNDDPVRLRLTRVPYTEEICMNLISPSVLDKNGISTIFGNGECKMMFSKSTELIGNASKTSVRYIGFTAT